MCAPHMVRGYNMIKKRNLVMKYALLDSRLNRVIVIYSDKAYVILLFTTLLVL